MTDLFAKYDVPAPRYTSYPTVPFWTDSPTSEQWIGHLNKAFDDPTATWSLYFHLPFCESLCTFCACNTVITRDHGREEGYIDLLSTEWNLYLDRVPDLTERPLLGVHLGGGTPTFFAKENLERILKPILSRTHIDQDRFEASVEVHPGHTTREQLATSMSPETIGRLSYDPFGLTRLPQNVSAAAPGFGQGQELFSSADGLFRVEFVEARDELRTYRDCAHWLDVVKGIVAREGAKVGGPRTVVLSYTGRPAFVAEIATSMERDMTKSILGTAGIIAVLFWLAHRRIKPMLWLLALLALILASTLGLGALIAVAFFVV